MERMRDWKYGKCMKCGENIPVGRLMLMPGASRCVRCLDRVPSWIDELSTWTRRKEIPPAAVEDAFIWRGYSECNHLVRMQA